MRAFLMSLLLVLAGSAQASRDFGAHPGYLSSTERERNQDEAYVDMIVIRAPLVEKGPILKDLIFNAALSKEFRERYEDKFGRTEPERSYHAPNQFTYYNDSFGLKGTPQEINEERRSFAEFMLRRLAEFHFENYAKNDPKVRPIWEAKERISNVAIEVRRVRFDLQYSVVGNTFDVKVVNPWLSLARFRVEMDPGALGPSRIDEVGFSLGVALSEKSFVESHFRVEDGVISLIGRHAVNSQLSASLSASTFTKDGGKTRRESLYLAGMGFIF